MPRTQAEAAIQGALAEGIRYFDSAPFYGFGLSERRIGDCLRGRSNVIVSTKVGRLLIAAPPSDTASVREGFLSPMPFTSQFDYSYDGVMRSYEASLQRLGLARVSILYVHDIGRRTHGDQHEFHWRALFDRGGYKALDELRTQGVIDAIGLGVNEWQVAFDALNVARFDILMIAGRYTLLDQSALVSLLPRCEEAGVQVVAAAVYNSGILIQGSGGSPQFDYAPASLEIVDRVRKLEARCREFNLPLGAAALQFPLKHPCISTVVTGMGTAQHVRQSVAFAKIEIPKEFWQSLYTDQLICTDLTMHQFGDN